MKNATFVKEPGFLQDLLFPFVWRFNRENLAGSVLGVPAHTARDRDFNDRVLNLYCESDVISEELRPFFFLRDGQIHFLNACCLDPQADRLAAGEGTAVLKDALADVTAVAGAMADFFFPEETAKTRAACAKDFAVAAALIKASDYAPAVKSGLYGFFLDPAPTVETLRQEVLAREAQLTQQYKKDQAALTQLQKEINPGELTANLRAGKDTKISFDGSEHIYISFCLLDRNAVRVIPVNDGHLLVLGSAYRDVLESCMLSNVKLDLAAFGNALGEKNRMDILELILTNGEVTMRQVQEALRFTATNAYYHITLMLRAGVLKARNQGRTIYYSINGPQFDSARTALVRYTGTK